MYINIYLYICVKKGDSKMEIKLTKIQIIHLEHICKKGWGGYSEPNAFLDEMVVSSKWFIDKKTRTIW